MSRNNDVVVGFVDIIVSVDGLAELSLLAIKLSYKLASLPSSSNTAI